MFILADVTANTVGLPIGTIIAAVFGIFVVGLLLSTIFGDPYTRAGREIRQSRRVRKIEKADRKAHERREQSHQ